MRYTVILEQESDGGYVASVPALPGCVSQGDTRDEVMKNGTRIGAGSKPREGIEMAEILGKAR